MIPFFREPLNLSCRHTTIPSMQPSVEQSRLFDETSAKPSVENWLVRMLTVNSDSSHGPATMLIYKRNWSVAQPVISHGLLAAPFFFASRP